MCVCVCVCVYQNELPTDTPPGALLSTASDSPTFGHRGQPVSIACLLAPIDVVPNAPNGHVVIIWVGRPTGILHRPIVY
jgi:hypothetical protein